MIHCEKCLIVLTNSVGSGTVLCKECQAKGEKDIFDTQPTCGELSCDECNERYKKAVARIQALEDAMRELVTNGKAAIKETGYPVTHIQMQWDDSCDKALEHLNGGK